MGKLRRELLNRYFSSLERGKCLLYNQDYFVATSSFQMKLISFKWERVQLLMTLSIKDKDTEKLDFYLFHPQTERSVYFYREHNDIKNLYN